MEEGAEVAGTEGSAGRAKSGDVVVGGGDGGAVQDRLDTVGLRHCRRHVDHVSILESKLKERMRAVTKKPSK